MTIEVKLAQLSLFNYVIHKDLKYFYLLFYYIFHKYNQKQSAALATIRPTHIGYAGFTLQTAYPANNDCNVLIIYT